MIFIDYFPLSFDHVCVYFCKERIQLLATNKINTVSFDKLNKYYFRSYSNWKFVGLYMFHVWCHEIYICTDNVGEDCFSYSSFLRPPR